MARAKTKAHPHTYRGPGRLSGLYTMGRDGKPLPAYVAKGSSGHKAWRAGSLERINRAARAKGTPAALPIGGHVWVLVEEVAVGSENGDTNWVLGVYASEAGKDAAADEWREEHGDEGGDEGHAFKGDDHWCEVCDHGLEVSTLRLEA
jgi:hypothetical protein